MVKKMLLKTDIKRAKGKLYFCGTEDGMVTVMSTNMAYGKRKENPKEATKEKKK